MEFQLQPSVLVMNTQDRSPLGWTGSPRESQVPSPTPQFKSINCSVLSFLYGPTLTSIKTIALTRWTFVGEAMSLLFNMLSRLVTREGNSTPLQYSCLENPMDGGAWEAAVHGVVKSRTRLSDFTFTFHFPALEKEMATHSSVLAWRIPGTGSLVGCRLWGCTGSDTTEET